MRRAEQRVEDLIVQRERGAEQHVARRRPDLRREQVEIDLPACAARSRRRSARHPTAGRARRSNGASLVGSSPRTAPRTGRGTARRGPALGHVHHVGLPVDAVLGEVRRAAEHRLAGRGRSPCIRLAHDELVVEDLRRHAGALVGRPARRRDWRSLIVVCGSPGLRVEDDPHLRAAGPGRVDRRADLRQLVLVDADVQRPGRVGAREQKPVICSSTPRLSHASAAGGSTGRGAPSSPAPARHRPPGTRARTPGWRRPPG